MSRRVPISERTDSPFTLGAPQSIDRLIQSTIDRTTQDDLADRRDVETFLRRNR